jgi:hypothetical protein
MNPVRPGARQQTGLPLELRCALDIIATEVGAFSGVINGDLVGAPVLIEELSRYAPVSTSPDLLIMLMESSDWAEKAQAEARPCDVWTVTAGPLHRLLRPLRSQSSGGVPIVEGMTARQWAAQGYHGLTVFGVQGPGSIVWAVCERLCRRFGRPDIADRCRIGMLRTLISARPFNVGAVRVCHYQRMKRHQ